MRKYFLIVPFLVFAVCGCDLIAPRAASKASAAKDKALEFEQEEDAAIVDNIVRPVFAELRIGRDLFKPLVVKVEPVKPVVPEVPEELKVKEPVIPPVKTASQLGLVFTGAVTTGGSTIGLVRSKTGTLSVRSGDLLQEMKVRLIMKDRIVLEDAYGRDIVIETENKVLKRSQPGEVMKDETNR